MVISSKGYSGTVPASAWAGLVPRAGSSDYGVGAFGELRATIGGGTRSIQLSAGRLWGHGVLDTSSAVETIAFPSQPTGDRWDLVVARRAWTPKTTTLEIVPGGSLKQIPARPNTTPGAIDDQPLWLARIRAGQSAVQELVDLRLVPRPGGVAAFDLLARQYANELGTQLVIEDVLWVRWLDSSSNLRWLSHDMSDTGWVTGDLGINFAEHFEFTSYRLRRKDERVRGRVVVRRKSLASTPEPVADARGAFPSDANVLRLPAGWRSPVTETPVMRGAETGVPLFPSMDPDGLVTVGRALPGQVLSKSSRFIIDFDHPVN